MVKTTDNTFMIRKSVRKELFLYLPVHFAAAKSMAMYVEVDDKGECTGVTFRRPLKEVPANSLDCTEYARKYAEREEGYDREQLYDDITAAIIKYLEAKKA